MYISHLGHSDFPWEGLCLCEHCMLLHLDPQDLLLPLGFGVEECLSSTIVM